MERTYIPDKENETYISFRETQQELNWRWLIRTETISMAGGEIVLFDFVATQLVI